MDELIGFLFLAAIQFSGIPAAEPRPPIQGLPYPSMLREVCDDLRSEAGKHERCLAQSGLVAAYIVEQRRIVYRDDLDLDNDSDNSFIVHEFVHALQAQHYGARVFETCQGVLFLERQAYQAQQKYLKSRGQLLQVGDRLRFVTCGDLL